MSIFLVRHGEAWSNLPEYNKITGSDQELTPTGKRQAEQTARRLGGLLLGPVELHSSPLTRARQTADIIAAELSVDVQIEPRLREVDRGIWQGRAVDYVLERQAAIPLVDRPYHRPLWGENWLQMAERVSSFILELDPDENSILVSHNHPIRMAVGALLERPIEQWGDLPVSNASIVQLQNINGNWQLVDNDAISDSSQTEV